MGGGVDGKGGGGGGAERGFPATLAIGENLENEFPVMCLKLCSLTVNITHISS